MKNNLFKLVKKDLDTAKEDNDKFFVTNLNNIVTRINDVETAIGKELTNDDVLIILKNIHREINSNTSNSLYYDSTYSDKIKKLLEMINNYFNAADVTIDSFNKTTFSNNASLIDIDNQIKNANESLEIKNSISSILFITGIIIIIISFFLGIISGKVDDSFSLPFAIIYWLFGGMSGLLIIGFSETIKILHDIRRKMYTRK